MRVVMYVQSDVVHDSRVLREAEALALAGHRVTVVGKVPPGPGVDPEVPAGQFDVVRVAPSTHPPYLRAPWRYVQDVLGRSRAAAARGPLGWPRAVAGLLAAAAALPWTLLRVGWVGIVNNALGRPVDFHALDRIRVLRYELLGWRTAVLAIAPRADVHHAHDLEALPAAAAAAARDRAALVYDKHELVSGNRIVLSTSGWQRWIVDRWERRLARGAAGCVTVNAALAVEVSRRLGSGREPLVVRNCPPRYDPPAEPVDQLRAALGLAAGTPIAIYHGGFGRERGLEQLAAAIREPGCEAVHAVYLGYGALEPELRAMAAEPAAGGRLHVLAAVPPAELLDWLTTADVAVMAIQPTTLNHRLSTPNKLFEAIAAGVPVVASDFPAIAEVVADPAGSLGVLVDPTSPAAIAAAIRGVLELPPAERAALRARCLAAAHERWNWETESARLVELYGRLTGRPW